MFFGPLSRQHSSKILTIQQGITRGVSSVGKPCRPEHGFPRPNCPGNAPTRSPMGGMVLTLSINPGESVIIKSNK